MSFRALFWSLNICLGCTTLYPKKKGGIVDATQREHNRVLEVGKLETDLSAKQTERLIKLDGLMHYPVDMWTFLW